MVTKKVHLKGADEALRLFGQHDQNLRYLEQSFGVQIFGRGDVLSVRGAPGKVEKALVAITGAALTPKEIFQKYSGRVVEVQTLNSKGEIASTGTGFLLDK